MPFRILVADDDVSARTLMQATLRKLGLEVSLAVNGLDAVQQYRRERHDMVMLDVDMPDMDGHEACTVLRAEAGALLPIVMVTGMDDLQSVERAFESGATDFIAKPINWPLLAHRVRYLLRSYETLLELRLTNARHTAVLNAIPDQLFEVDGDGVIVDRHVSRACSPEELAPVMVGRTVNDALPPLAADVFLSALREAHEQGSSVGKQFDIDGPQGSRWFELSVACKAGLDDRKPHFIVLSREITARKKAEMRIARLAYFDSLTGLPNRQSFLERVDREIRRAGHDSRRIAVLFMDLDGFKNVNDTLGHGAGDLLLQLAAQRLNKGLRPVDVVALTRAPTANLELSRLGGDEFAALMLPVREPKDVLTVGERIGELMRSPFILNGRAVTLTASIGIALYPDDGHDAETLLKHADTAMYHAKSSGRDNAQIYSAALTERATQRLELNTSLRTALERDEFTLMYQPQIDADAQRVQSVEALIRWQHPTRGMLAPLDFMPIAEEFGLIEGIDRWVLRTACTDAARWNRAGRRVMVAVNLSPVHLQNPDFVSVVMDVLASTGLEPGLLELEITEGSLMENSAATIARLHALRERGVHIALDDFGTGYSSLGYLTRMPIGNLKADRSLVVGQDQGGQSLAVMRAVLAMASSLGIRVTAEGVETLAQARALRAMDCRYFQGFWFSRPVPSSEVPALLARRWLLDEPAASDPLDIATEVNAESSSAR